MANLGGLLRKAQMNKIGIIGVGKLGLVYALSFEKNGCEVWASSYKKDYVGDLQAKRTDSVEPGVREMLNQSKNIFFTTNNHEVINHCDIIYVLVATPSLPEGNYDVSAIDMVVEDFLNHDGKVDNKILIIGSTVNPGDCSRFQKKLENHGVHVVYSPTFAAQGTVVYDIENPIAVSFGSVNKKIVDRCMQAFSAIIPSDTQIFHLHPTTAEIMKLAANCYGTLRINYYNMIGRILLTCGLEHDITKVNEYLNDVDRRKNKLRFGFGYGGPCYPRDNRSFSHFSQSIGIDNQLSILNDELNQEHSRFLADYLMKKNIFRLPFYFPYVSYKPGVKIFEESNQLAVCRSLLSTGAKVYIEPSEFLDNDVIEKLKHHFPSQVEIKSKSMIDQDIYQVIF